MKVEIWSDVVCPWCYIGKRRFEGALARFAHRDQVEVVWRSFELDPKAPRQHTGDMVSLLASKYGRSPAQAQSMLDQVTATAAKDGLKFDLAASRGGNTFDAHRVLHLAAEHGLQGAAKERFLAAYFTEGRSIGDRDTITALATEVGLDATETRSVLESDRFATEVRNDERDASRLGVQGVPFFVMDRKFGVSGAQPVEALLQALEQAWGASQAKQADVPAGDAGVCDDGECAV
jgi:predicted DsbA family dithiol-disulfide isomerase